MQEGRVKLKGLLIIIHNYIVNIRESERSDLAFLAFSGKEGNEMIDTDRTFGTTTIYCDVKGCDYDETFDGFDGYIDFGSAIGEAKRNGWTMRKVDGEWEHYCPGCSEDLEGDQRWNGK